MWHNQVNKSDNLIYSKTIFLLDSIFHKLWILDTKILQVDQVYNGTTMIHHVEEMLQVNSKYFKNFSFEFRILFLFDSKILIHIILLCRG